MSVRLQDSPLDLSVARMNAASGATAVVYLSGVADGNAAVLVDRWPAQP